MVGAGVVVRAVSYARLRVPSVDREKTSMINGSNYMMIALVQAVLISYLGTKVSNSPTKPFLIDAWMPSL